MIVPRVVTTPLMRPSSITSDLAEVLAKALSLPVRDALVDELARDGLRARDDQAGVRVPEAALDQLLLDQRELLLDLRGVDQPARVPNALAESILRRISSMRTSSPTRATSRPPIRA